VRAAVFDSTTNVAPGAWLSIKDVPPPPLQPQQVLLKVLACGVCRTDLHIVERDLAPLRPAVIPGHQTVGEVVEGATASLPAGTRVGVSWIGGVDGDCWFCRHQRENLCDHPVFTGYSVDGGYAEFAAVRADFAHVLSRLCRHIGACVAGSQFFRVLGARSDGYRVSPSDERQRNRKNWPQPAGLRGKRAHTALSS
jgi:D-arabinose 1-dehydrogenase-like Zn-dependent alcohol dehydrogenase